VFRTTRNSLFLGTLVVKHPCSECQHGNEKVAQLSATRFVDQAIEVASFPYEPEHVQWALARHQQMVAVAAQQLGGWFATELGSDTVARLDLTQSREQPSNVSGITRVNDVDVERRDRRPRRRPQPRRPERTARGDGEE
jgi:hypothetical protein